MSFICKNGTEHRHDTIDQAKQCWGILRQPVPASGPVTAPVRPYEHAERATGAQVRYVEILGGDSTLAAGMTKTQASQYIDSLKKEKARVSTPTPSVPLPPAPTSPPTKVPVALLQMVREGRYAVRPDSAHPFTFLRITRPKTGKYKDTIKVQTQHGPNLSDPKFVVWPSGKVSVYRWDIEEPLLLVIADQQGAARAYARELGRCARCGLELTDEQSRRWGVGPECIKHWPHMAVLADEEDEG